MLKKGIAEDSIQWKNIPCSYTGRNNIMKMAIPPNLKYRVNALPFKFFMAYFICLDKNTRIHMEL